VGREQDAPTTLGKVEGASSSPMGREQDARTTLGKVEGASSSPMGREQDARTTLGKVEGASSSPVGREQDAPTTLGKVEGASSSPMGREQDARTTLGKVEGASSSPVVGEQDAPATLGKVEGASSSPMGPTNTPLSQTEPDAFTWEYFNPLTEIDVRTGGYLPHWEQGEVWYFITFRLADALPRLVVEKIKLERERWREARDLANLSRRELAEYHQLFSERYENLLHAGNGACLLRDPQNAEIMHDTLRFFEGERYALDEYVIMPNHVHVLVKPFAGHGLVQILHAWKSFSANQINRLMGRTGQLWQHESYDHIVRNESAMQAIRLYIRANPGKVSG